LILGDSSANSPSTTSSSYSSDPSNSSTSASTSDSTYSTPLSSTGSYSSDASSSTDGSNASSTNGSLSTSDSTESSSISIFYGSTYDAPSEIGQILESSDQTSSDSSSRTSSGTSRSTSSSSSSSDNLSWNTYAPMAGRHLPANSAESDLLVKPNFDNRAHRIHRSHSNHHGHHHHNNHRPNPTNCFNTSVYKTTIGNTRIFRSGCLTSIFVSPTEKLRVTKSVTVTPLQTSYVSGTAVIEGPFSLTSLINQSVTFSMPDPDQTAFVTVTINTGTTQTITSSQTDTSGFVVISSVTSVSQVYRTDMVTSYLSSSLIFVPSGYLTQTIYTSIFFPTQTIDPTYTVNAPLILSTVNAIITDLVSLDISSLLDVPVTILNTIPIVTSAVDLVSTVLSVQSALVVSEVNVLVTAVSNIIASINNILL
jgi:hypothetical protein